MVRFMVFAVLFLAPCVANAQYLTPQQQARVEYGRRLRMERAYREEMWARQYPYAAQRAMMMEAAREQALRQEEYRRMHPGW